MRPRDLVRPAIRHGRLGLFVAAALVAAGCGGSSATQPVGPAPSAAASSGSAPGAATSTGSRPANDPRASRLIAKADAVCRRVNDELAPAPPRVSAAQIAQSSSRNAALERRAVVELSKLRPPASLARDWRQILAYRRTLAEELVELGRDAKANDAPAIGALAASKKRVHAQLSALAIRAGFKDCAQAGSTHRYRQTNPAPPSTIEPSPL